MSDTSASNTDVIEDQRKRFRGRAYDARRQANYFLLLILVLLVGAASVLVLAPQITNRDITFEVDERLSAENVEETRILTELIDLNYRVIFGLDEGGCVPIKPSKKELSLLLKSRILPLFRLSL